MQKLSAEYGEGGVGSPTKATNTSRLCAAAEACPVYTASYKTSLGTQCKKLQKFEISVWVIFSNVWPASLRYSSSDPIRTSSAAVCVLLLSLCTSGESLALSSQKDKYSLITYMKTAIKSPLSLKSNFSKLFQNTTWDKLLCTKCIYLWRGKCCINPTGILTFFLATMLIELVIDNWWI